MRRPGRALVMAVALGAALAGGCKGKKKRELGLSRARDGAPVVVVDRAVQSGFAGPVAPEVEPNDARDQAGRLELPGGIEGALAGEKDVDIFRLEPGPARAVNVQLTGPGDDEGGVDLVLELHDADGTVIAKSDRGPAGVVEGLPNAALAAGAAHYLSVSRFVKKARKKGKAKDGAEAPPGSYRLAVDTVEPVSGAEAEPNDTPDGAREVLLADEATGYVGWSKDVDHWILNLAGFSGGYALDVAVDGVEGVALTAEVVATDGRVIATRKGEAGRGVRIRGMLPEVGARQWLARVTGSRSNPQEPYRLRPTARELAEGEEAEPNDDEERAIVVGPLGDGLDGERRGHLDGGDVDFYRFEGGREPLTLNLSVEPPSGVDLVVRVLRPGGQEVRSVDGGKAGVREVLDALTIPGGGAVVIAVGGTALGDEPDPYLLRWSTRADLTAPMRDPDQEPDPSEDLDPGDPYE